MRRKIGKGLRKSMALLLSVAVFAGTVDMRAYATEAEIATEVEAAVEETVAVEESVTGVETESVATEVTESEGETQTTGDVVEEESKEENKEESLTGEITVETTTEEICSVENTEEETKALEVEETTAVEATEIETTEVETTEEATTEEVTETDSTWDGVTTVSVYEAENYTVTFTLNSEWGTGYNASVKVENTGDTVIHDWHLEYASMHTITNIWNAVVYESTDDTCVIKNAGWNQDILAGGFVEFGFSGEGAFTGFPESYELLGDKTEANTEDYDISYQLNSDWGSGFSGSISITNNTDTTLEDWMLEFDFAREITSIWNATMESYEDNHYVIMNAGYNENIGAGQTISFGFNGQGGEAEDVPSNYQLYSYQLKEAETGTTIDLEADAENDGLQDYLEDYFGTDKTKADTDGDGVSDYWELYSLVLDPLVVDTDGNGVNDGDEDLDKDGLTNSQELEIGTSILKEDTDKDGLTDYEEYKIYGTNPLREDTDGDGASDAKEVELGSNPLVAEESFAVSISATEEDTVKVSIATTLSGDQVDGFRVEKYENDLFFPETMPGYIGGAYDFTVDGSINEATISFTFDEALLNEESFEPVIYYFNEETQLLEALETTVTGNTATTQVSHFSKYILLNRTVYEESFTWQDVWDTNGYTGVEIVLVIDDSGSMVSNDRQNQRLTVARNLVEKLPENSKIGVVRFVGSATALTSELTADKEQAKSLLTTNYFISSGGTSMYRGIKKGFELFQSTEDTVLKTIVVLSDGVTGDTYQHSSVVNTAVANGIKIYAVGLGSSSSGYFTRYLKPLAENTSGAFYLAEDASQLEEIYADINEKIDIETDSDGDGIADYYEDNLTMFNGVTITLDKNNPDTDGDGLWDGEEVVELNYQYNEDKTQVIVTGKLVTNPLTEDSDGDGLTDEEEIYYYGTNPLLADTDHDGLDDRTEIELWFDPLEADYDKDGRLDLQEYEEGTDPFGYTEDWNDYAWDFICGVVAGDIIENPENVATMLGQVAGSFIPLMDLRDVLANLAYENYGYALLSGAGLIPVLGDGAKTLGAFVEFILKNIDNTAMIVDVFTQLSRNADWLIKEAANNEKFQQAVKILHSKSDNLKLTKQQTEAINEVIEKADMSEYKIKIAPEEIVLKGTEYTEEYAQKLKDTYKIFKNRGYEISEHGLNRILGRINQGKINSIDEVIDVLNTGTKYKDTINGGTVLFKNGISIHISEDDFIKTVIGNAKIKTTWEILE